MNQPIDPIKRIIELHKKCQEKLHTLIVLRSAEGIRVEDNQGLFVYCSLKDTSFWASEPSIEFMDNMIQVVMEDLDEMHGELSKLSLSIHDKPFFYQPKNEKP